LLSTTATGSVHCPANGAARRCAANTFASRSSSAADIRSGTLVPQRSARPLIDASLRNVDRAHHRTCLVARLHVLLFGRAVIYDAARRLHVCDARLHPDRPDRQRGIAVSGHVAVADASAVAAAPPTLQLGEDLHRPDLRPPCHCPGPE